MQINNLSIRLFGTHRADGVHDRPLSVYRSQSAIQSDTFSLSPGHMKLKINRDIVYSRTHQAYS